MSIITQRYHPVLSDVLTLADLPEFLSFGNQPLTNLLDKIHYKDLQYSKSLSGDSANYSLEIVSKKRIGFELFGSGISFVLNPDFQDGQISSFPVILQYRWEVLAFLKSFKTENFSFFPQDVFRLGLKLFRISEEDATTQAIKTFVSPEPNTGKLQQVTNDIATSYGAVYNPSSPDISVYDYISEVGQSVGQNASSVIFNTYILNSVSFEVTKTNLKLYFSSVLPGKSLENYIKEIIMPWAKVSFSLTAAIEFPRSILIPVDSTTYQIIPPDSNGNPKVQLQFAEAEFLLNTNTGFEQRLQFAGTLNYPAMLGKTGLTVNFINLKLDLSRTTNIPEAAADGRPPDFVGVFVQEATIGFPQFWNHDGTNSTAVIKGRNLIIGTGGISGFISLESGQPTGGGQSLFTLGNAAPGKHFGLAIHQFFIEFKQNAIVQSEVRGTLKIPGFKHGNADAEIDVLVHIGHNGDFRITASDADGAYTFGIPGVFEIALRSVSIGRENSKWYLEAAGSLTITATIPHVETDFLKAPIEIKRLRIYQDGSLEFVGGGITLPTFIHISLGPVSLAMDHISFSSHEALYYPPAPAAPVNRQYFCFGFSGNLNIGRGSVDVRGDGVEFHFTRDNITFPLHTYLRIAGIGVDIKIPASASKEAADVFISGYLGMRRGTDTKGDAIDAGPEYQGSISVDLNKLKIHGKASMSMQPKVPAWIVDMELELATPLALGATGLGIYGFRGLIGSHYVASKAAADLTEEATWYEYLKKEKPPGSGLGITKEKFDAAKEGVSVGLGASIATMGDEGWAFSSKVFILLSMPEMFLIEGKASALHKRMGINNTEDPPFYAFLVIDSQSIQAGLGVDFRTPERDGKIMNLRGEMQMAFFFGNSSAWYINIGRDLPVEKRVQARLFKLFDAYAYLMLSNKGIRAGAGAKFSMEKKFGPVRAGLYAFLDIKGSISFKPLQIAGAIQLGGGLYLKISRFGIEIYIAAGLSAEAPMPFIIAGFIEIKLKIAIFKVRIKLEFTWVIEKKVETAEVKLIDAADFSSQTKADQYPFRAINILSEEAFILKYLSFDGHGNPESPDVRWDEYIIPMDSFIDIEFKRPVKPYLNRYGGGVSPLPQFNEYVAPQKSRMPQVKHSFIIENVELKIWNPDKPGWESYDPWEALESAFRNAGLSVNTGSFPFGYWQYNNNPGKYTSLRLLAQTPFAVSNGTPPEQFGILSQHMLCKGKPATKTCQYWTGIELTKMYPPDTVLRDRTLLLHFIKEAGSIGFIPNSFGIQPSLKVEAGHSVEIYFKEPMAAVTLSLTALSGVHIRYYQKEFTGTLTLSGLPRYDYRLINEADYGWQDLLNEITFEDVNYTVSKLVVTTNTCGEDIYSNFLNYWSEINNRWNGDNSNLTAWQQQQIQLWLESFGRGGGNIINIALVKLCGQWNALLDSGELPADEINKLEYWKSIFCGNDIDYTTILNNLDTEFSEVLLDYDRYQHIYSGVFEWKEKYCNGYSAATDFDICSSYIHEACWLTEPQREHNILLQQNDQAFIAAGANTLTRAINEVLPPIWRPNSSYAIVISTRDEIDAGGATDVSDSHYPHLNTFAIGFKTVGTLGFFHQTQEPWLLLERENKADQYKLSGLRHYIDYGRSYPNADGNILGAKPLYYENPKLALFFTKPYVYEFFTLWDRYKENPQQEYQLLSVIMDPANISPVPVVPPEVMGWQVHMGAQAIPIDAADIETTSNIFSQGDQTCTIITDTIKPPTMNAEVQRAYAILPQKLYRAVFKALDLQNSQDSIVHTYTFETSKYGNFSEHIHSYIRKMKDVDTGEEVTKNAIFQITLPSNISFNVISTQIRQILLNTLPYSSELLINYATAYDRIITGVLNMQALQAPTDVEFNIIRGMITIGGRPPHDVLRSLAILIRSPEPFNNPNLPNSEMQKTVKVINLENEDEQFNYVFSKDNSSILVTNTNLNMLQGRLRLTFTQVSYNGVTYVYPETLPVNIDLGYF